MNTDQPLAGRRIVVTRSRRQASSLSEALSALGAEVIELPLIEILPPESYAPLDRALQNMSQYQWLVTTSANTARVLAERIAALRLDHSIFSTLKIAAVGSATALALREQGWKADFIPKEYVAESVVASLGDHVRGGRVLLARASVARDIISEELTRLGATVDVVDAYRTVIPAGAVEQFRKVFDAGAARTDAVTFTSSSTVKHFFMLLHEAGLSAVPDMVMALSIGPITSATLREHRWEAAVEAMPHDVDGLVRAIVSLYRAC